ncbi:MAG: AAA family ATPase, partial [Desulfovibrio sp.]|nr:AAA family ATPase [Desulfovibrio sp.]
MDPSGRLRGFFVAGTDTDAGKTFVCARLARLLGRVAAGRLSYLKPVQTGCTPRPAGT